MKGGAWPFLVGGVICLVNSVNERDLGLLTRGGYRLGIKNIDWKLDYFFRELVYIFFNFLYSYFAIAPKI